MTTVAHILDKKSNDVACIDADASVLDAIRLLAELEIGALVVKKNNEVVGILSERDYARQVILKGRSSESTVVEEIMTSPVVSTNLKTDIQACMSLMTSNRFRHLPVIEDGELVGIVSMGDLVKFIIAEQHSTIEQLERYVTG